LRHRTIMDVSRLAQVSAATVSRAFSGGPVNERTRKRIIESAARLGYVPNIAAASLRGRHPRIVGVASYLVYSENLVQHAILEGISRELEDSDFNIILTPFTSLPRQAWLVSIMEQGLLGGLISVTEGTIGQEPYRNALQHEIPLVTVEYKWPGTPSAEIDQEAGGRLAAAHLLTRTRNLVTFSLQSAQNPNAIDARIAGFKRELARPGTPKARLNVMTCKGLEFEEGKRLGRILAQRSTRPLGVFCATGDRFALGVWQAMHEQGWQLRKDLFLVGFDNIPLSRYATPALTTISQRLEELGKLAAKMVIKEYSGEKVPPERHVLQPVLIERETT